jgi:hypothetical protein
MSDRSEKGALIYCRFGDVRAMSVIYRIQEGLNLAKRRIAMEETLCDSDDFKMWSGGLTMKDGGGSYPMAVAIIRPGCSLDDFPAAAIYDPASRLHIIADGRSKHGSKNGLIRFHGGMRPAAHIRREERIPLPQGYERDIAIQILDSFVVHRYLRAPRPAERREKLRPMYFAEACA